MVELFSKIENVFAYLASAQYRAKKQNSLKVIMILLDAFQIKGQNGKKRPQTRSFGIFVFRSLFSLAET